MQPTNTKTGGATQGFTMIPNAVIDNPNLCIRDKMVLIKVARHCYGSKKSAHPSQKAIADCLGIRRETAKAALESLTALGPLRPHGEGRSGRKETFTIDLDCAANLTTRSAGYIEDNLPNKPSGNLTTQSAAPDDSVGTKQTKQNTKPEKTASPRSAGSSLSEGEMPAKDEVLGNTHSAASPCEAVPQAANGNHEPEASLPASQGPQQVASTEQSDDADWPNDLKRPLRDVADDILDEVFGSGDTTPRWSEGQSRLGRRTVVRPRRR